MECIISEGNVTTDINSMSSHHNFYTAGNTTTNEQLRLWSIRVHGK